MDLLVTGLRVVNELLTAGIAITAFSLLLYALTFNLRDRVARSFAMILTCVVIVYVGDALAGITTSKDLLKFLLLFQWIGIIFLPAAYVHFSDALLVTTGRPSRGRRKWAARFIYLMSLGFLFMLPFSMLVGPLAEQTSPVPHLEPTRLTWLFVAFYALCITWSVVNFFRAYRRSVTSTSRRRMKYLLAGSAAPVMGSFPYLLFGSGFAAVHPVVFWVVLTTSNLLVSFLIVLMSYSVAFFGVSWPDRIVKRRLLKWLMRGPFTASMVLAVTTIVRRLGDRWGQPYTAFVPVMMVGSLLLFEYVITLAAPIWERWLFHGGDHSNVALLQRLEERVLTISDLKQFLESVLAAACDRLQSPQAIIAVLGNRKVEMIVSVGGKPEFAGGISEQFLREASTQQDAYGFFRWENYLFVPLYNEQDETELLGIMGVFCEQTHFLDDEQLHALDLLAQRASLALADRNRQQKVFTTLQDLTPKVDLIQRLRAAARYDGADVLTDPGLSLEQRNITKWVKDALTHYWGGPKLTESPLMQLQIVREILDEHQENPANALRAILRQAVEHIRPEGERRFTGEWILYNILELKFMEGRKVRDVALRLAMSEADLYRKQRVAIEAVASAIIEMEQRTRADNGVELTRYPVDEDAQTPLILVK